jgi:hypothetical protein
MRLATPRETWPHFTIGCRSLLPTEAQDRWLGSGERDGPAALVAFIKDAARNDFTVEALDSMPLDAPPRRVPQLKLFG